MKSPQFGRRNPHKQKTAYLEKYLQYLDNTGGCTVEQFDDDWDPIGPLIRKDLFAAGLAQVDCGMVVRITPPGAA